MSKIPRNKLYRRRSSAPKGNKVELLDRSTRPSQDQQNGGTIEKIAPQKPLATTGAAKWVKSVASKVHTRKGNIASADVASYPGPSQASVAKSDEDSTEAFADCSDLGGESFVDVSNLSYGQTVAVPVTHGLTRIVEDEPSVHEDPSDDLRTSSVLSSRAPEECPANGSDVLVTPCDGGKVDLIADGSVQADVTAQNNAATSEPVPRANEEHTDIETCTSSETLVSPEECPPLRASPEAQAKDTQQGRFPKSVYEVLKSFQQDSATSNDDPSLPPTPDVVLTLTAEISDQPTDTPSDAKTSQDSQHLEDIEFQNEADAALFRLPMNVETREDALKEMLRKVEACDDGTQPALAATENMRIYGIIFKDFRMFFVQSKEDAKFPDWLPHKKNESKDSSSKVNPSQKDCPDTDAPGRTAHVDG